MGHHEQPTRSRRCPVNAPYADAWQDYWAAGWRGILCMKPLTKSPPPSGFTGGQGVETSWADCFAWATDWTDGRGPGGNIALRMSDTVIGIDVDAYNGKTGARTIAEAAARWGELPPTWSSSARDDGSGIRPYRVPAGTRLVEAIKFPELAIGHVEIVQRHHRYAMVWPSIHPETRTMYRWRGPDGAITDQVPPVSDLPDLPSEWLTGLADGTHSAEAWAASGEVADFLDSLLDGGPCERVATYLAETITTLQTIGAQQSRHDYTRKRVMGLLRIGELGHYGVPTALEQLRDAWMKIIQADPRRQGNPWFEFRRMVLGSQTGSKAVGTILADPTPASKRICLCPTGMRIVLDQLDPELRAELAAFLGVDA